MIQVFYCTNTRDYTNIRSCREKLVFNSSHLQEGIFVYTLVKLYNKANLIHKTYTVRSGDNKIENNRKLLQIWYQMFNMIQLNNRNKYP